MMRFILPNDRNWRAFSLSPLCRTSRPFIGPILKGREGSKAVQLIGF